MNFKKWVKSIQTAGYNGARTVDYKPGRVYTKYFLIKFLILVQCDFRSRAAATRLDEYDKLFLP